MNAQVISDLTRLSVLIEKRKMEREIPIPLVWRKLPAGMVQRMTAKIRKVA